MHGLEIKEHIIFFVSLSIQYAYTIVYIYIELYMRYTCTLSARQFSRISKCYETLLDYPDLNHPGAGSRTSKCFSGAAGFCKDC